MSRPENKGMIDAYQQMLEDGSAFKEVDMTMQTEPDLTEAQGAEVIDNTKSEPLGQKVKSPEHEYFNDYSEHDSVMEQRIAKLRQKAGLKSTKKVGKIVSSKQEIKALKKRVALLEEAMQLVMETHEQLLED